VALLRSCSCCQLAILGTWGAWKFILFCAKFSFIRMPRFSASLQNDCSSGRRQDPVHKSFSHCLCHVCSCPCALSKSHGQAQVVWRVLHGCMDTVITTGNFKPSTTVACGETVNVFLKLQFTVTQLTRILWLDDLLCRNALSFCLFSSGLQLEP
jgi:hypothetical protein